jgi:hypothetical protein
MVCFGLRTVAWELSNCCVFISDSFPALCGLQSTNPEGSASHGSLTGWEQPTIQPLVSQLNLLSSNFLCSPPYSSDLHCSWSAADGTGADWRTPEYHFECKDIQVLPVTWLTNTNPMFWPTINRPGKCLGSSSAETSSGFSTAWHYFFFWHNKKLVLGGARKPTTVSNVSLWGKKWNAVASIQIWNMFQLMTPLDMSC